MNTSLIIIKLGGSVITYKNSPTPKARVGNVKHLAKEVAALFKTEKYKIVLVHGAGSFGHPIVKKHNLHRGMKTVMQKLAYAETVQNMLDLNEFIVKSLIDHSVPAVSLPPHSFATQLGGKFKGFNHNIIKKCLEKGQIPVLFGDAVLDDKWGCSILSGDVISSYLARELKAKKLIFLSDVDGIYTDDPKIHPNSKLIPYIDNKNYKSLDKNLNAVSTHTSNVTGEMRGKIEAIKENLKNIQVIITSGLKAGSLIKAVDNKRGTGTELYFK